MRKFNLNPSGGRLLLVLWSVLAVLSKPALAQDISYEQSKALSEAISADGRFQRSLEICPADEFGEEKGLMYRWGLASAPSWSACKADPLGCFEACRSGSALSCFRTARLLQRADNVFDKLDVQRMFAFGCLAGSRGSCTNRGASLRNALVKGDPFQDKDWNVRNACQFTLFKQACRPRSTKPEKGWGCVMLAQAYEFGEGVDPDVDEAKRIYRSVIATTCALKEDETVEQNRRHPACNFAEGRLEVLSDQ